MLRKKGFTLIELMIVVAIIGILSMFALPAYQDYTKRTYVGEGLNLASAAKIASTEYFATAGSEWPYTNAMAGLSAASDITGQAVSGIGLKAGPYASLSDIEKGKYAYGQSYGVPASTTNIVIVYNDKVVKNGQIKPTSDVRQPQWEGDNTLTLSVLLPSDPKIKAGSIAWACYKRGKKIEKKWLPSNCRGTVS